jgi:hypothetical protein
VGWIFREAIFTPRSFVFRDAGHYYYPLYAWTLREWAAGRIPLWNPLENCGAPGLADPTTSVFYPGKLVFLLPGDYPTCWKAYVLFHVLLAGATAFFTARQWRASLAAATACALSYALGGSVVFQYCNVVFLVGAAWLPLAFWAVDGLLRFRRWFWVRVLAVVLAMMVLGGDPQTAYHVGLVALLGWWIHGKPFLRWRWRPRLRQHVSPALPSPALRWRRQLHSRGLLLGFAAVFAFFLSAVQVLPTGEWSRRTERAAFDAPRSVYEIPSYVLSSRPAPVTEILKGLIGPPSAGHHRHLYQFSVGPWRWAEFLWPNSSGRLFPVSHRWIQAIPADDRAWSPSLYMGLAPLLAAFSAGRLFQGSHRERWLTWTALFALIAALGWYGLGWIGFEIQHAITPVDPNDAAWGAPTGGVYWLLVKLAPGYVQFRYPAKWMTVATLALSLLGARGWDRMFGGKSREAVRWTQFAAAFSLGGIVVWLAMRPLWRSWLREAPVDDFLGPLDVEGAGRDVLFSLIQTTVMSGLVWFLLRLATHGRRSLARPVADGNRTWLAWIAVVLTSFDLAIAHHGLAPTASHSFWEQTPHAARIIANDQRENPELKNARVFRGASQGWLPPEWKYQASLQRQVEGLAWDHHSLFPKHHLLAGVALAETHEAMAAADYAALLDVGRELGFRRPDGVKEPAPEVLDLLGVGYVLLPRGASLPGGQLLPDLAPSDELNNVSLWRNTTALPRAWVVSQWVVWPELDDRSPRSLRARARHVLLTGPEWRNLRRMAVVESDDFDAAGLKSAEARRFGEAGSRKVAGHHSKCRVVVAEPQRVEVEVDVTAPGLLVTNDLYESNWRAAYHTSGESPRELPVYRTNRAFRGVLIPAGAGKVVFDYRPAMFFRGAVISAAAWCGMLAFLLLRLISRSGGHKIRFR